MSKYFTIHLYDKYKNNLYTCFFLKNTEQEMNDIVYADYHFAREYRKSILFYTVFDIKLINTPDELGLHSLFSKRSICCLIIISRNLSISSSLTKI